MAVPLGLVAASRGEQGGGHKARTQEKSLITFQLSTCAPAAQAPGVSTLAKLWSRISPPDSPPVPPGEASRGSVWRP